MVRVDSSGRAAAFLQGLVEGAYLDGQCYELAAALRRGLGWPMVALMVGDLVRHAVVRHPDGGFWDARGRVGEEALGAPFGLTPGGFALREVEEADLRAVRSVPPDAVTSAARLAMALWPDLPWRELPWREPTWRDRVVAFAEELEELSRRHGVWLRSAVPAAPPMLARGEGDESGYRLVQTADGTGWGVDRVLDGEPPPPDDGDEEE
jgi:hypothetical protein